MQYRVTVPEGVDGGHVVSVNAEGTQFQVRVPPDVRPGESFLFSVEKPHTLILFHNVQDLGIALGLGGAIGLAIVVGFVLGVLFVTEPLSPPI
ncbi:hypothetical protein FisN_16Hu057 [Fistulifera solaris]|uniref:Uncharacterized protein n=1 Tax=Fistulifera solaris TaxID=1519565 RepID=A0A1Z5K718_FISSO|nr:hypothetical protein FisN_16Hu057 [Fistulifera solaris]|eukprot:GAX21952.1 hypothetical protein FisN_16Hu057 [Fistulifera solaris]